MKGRSPKPLDIFSAPLCGISLIEASAGTGKTYTIAGLYLRLLLEAEIPVDHILVVTYTNAATAELRERIRQRLNEALQGFERGEAADSFCEQLVRRIDNHDAARRRLRAALSGFDEAAIHTIHGFCQRALSDSAFESAMPFQTELLPDLSELLRGIADDYWRLNVYGESASFVEYLLCRYPDPQQLMNAVHGFVGKPYLDVVGPDVPAELNALEEQFAHLYTQARKTWQQKGEEIGCLLLTAPQLNRQRYRKDWLNAWIKQLDTFLAAPLPRVNLWDKFEKFTTETLAAAVKKGGAGPRHEFFDICQALWDLRVPLAEAYEKKLAGLKAGLLTYCNGQLRLTLGRLQLQSYDNLLLSLAQALDGAHGERLAATLRGRYSAALIDEFQDTDPVQYGIFSTIYRGTEYPVFMVGDPKQAIYSFRGADVFAYIDARRHSQRCFTLNRNWRSAPLLVDAVNHLFREAGMRAFVLDEIPFRPVQAAQIPDRETLGEGNDRAPFRFWFLPAGESGKPLSKGAAVPRVADMVANEIARLLSMGSMGQARIGRRAVEGGDIAVLVRDHRQGWAVRQALSSLGISSVQQMQDSVFHTREAEQLERVLLAVAEPHRASRVRSALATDLLGLDGSDILSLAADEEAWADWLDRFRAYRQQWLDRGFARMMRQLIIESGLRARLLRYADGERRLTNVSQLVELLQAESLTSSGSMDSLLRWLADQRTGWQGKEEVSQLRLESDEQLVKIVTIHKSKGLEYPIVFCPFLWDGRLRIPTESAFSFHDPGRAFQAVLDLGSPGHEAARALAIQEEMAENLRLLYVALTRARHRCYVLWGNLASAGQSALGWLLHPPPDVSPGWFDQVDGSFSAWGDGALLARLEQLVSTSEGSMRIEPVPEPEAPSQGSSQKAPGEFRCRHFGREFGAAPRVLSFSSLNNALDRPERPDHDAVFDTEPVSVAVERPDTIFSFPRGARAGSCLHWIFEQIDFRPADGAQIADYCERGLAAHGLDAEWLPVVVDTVLRVLATPLDEPGRITLSQVSRQRRMVELEFHFPLATLEPRNLADRIARDVTGHRHAQSMVASMRRLDFGQVRGFMTGFIDLVFEHGGRYYLADYKSNWLGDQRSDYAAPSLVQSMEQHGYYLQYLIYSVALHRYLAHRLPDYAYQRHFGGVFYLFLRGMDPGADGDYGIYRDRPSESLIQTLDRMMMEGSC